MRLRCPNCSQDKLRWKDGAQVCGTCCWRGNFYQCHPAPEPGLPEPAGPDDAVCANHSDNKAVSICAATGDYICELCKVHVDGKDYSIQYFGCKGDDVFANELHTTVPRPDRIMKVLMWLSIFLPVLAPFFWLFSTMYWRRAARLSAESAIYRRAAAGKRPWLYWTVTMLVVVVAGAVLLSLMLALPAYTSYTYNEVL